MTALSEIMTPGVRCVDADATLRELAEFLIEEDVSGAPVVAGGALVGVVSVTDLVAFDADGRGVPVYESVGPDESGMSDEDPTPRSSAFFADPWDDGRESVRTRLSVGGPIWSSLDDRTIDEVMTRDLLTMPASADVQDAAAAMVEAGVHRLLVMKGDQLLGVVTTTDVVRAVAEKGLG
ncbi:MAG: CBS domain-containing protein [Gemmatimonadota bacterium]|nr:CBS domain-containing protein [Gemmatimonadota bacterium]